MMNKPYKTKKQMKGIVLKMISSHDQSNYLGHEITWVENRNNGTKIPHVKKRMIYIDVVQKYNEVYALIQADQGLELADLDKVFLDQE